MKRLLTDRLLVLLIGVGLAAGGILLADWGHDRLLALPSSLDTSPAATLTDESWWPWAQGGTGVVLALLALWWLTARLPRRGPSTLGLSGSDRNGTATLDLGSLGSTLTGRLEQSGTVTGAHATFRRTRGTTVARVRARLTGEADLEALVETAESVAADLATALPDEQLDLQLRVSAPRRARGPRPAQRGTVRIH